MRKDIEIPISRDVYVVMVLEWNKEFLARDWNAYIVNNRATPIEMALVVSKGYDGDKKTTTMRYAFGIVAAKGYEKIEMVTEDVLRLNNEFFVTYYADNKLYEKRFFFEKNSVNQQQLVPIPILNKDGILGRWPPHSCRNVKGAIYYRFQHYQYLCFPFWGPCWNAKF